MPKKRTDAFSSRTYKPDIASVLIDRRVLAGFRKRAKQAYPLEFLEVMFGEIIDDVASVHVMLPLPHKATREACDYDHDDVELLQEDVAAQGLTFVGTIHSHPSNNTCSHPSETDHETGVRFKEPVMAVCWVRRDGGKMRSTVSFNVPRKPVKVKFGLKA